MKNKFFLFFLLFFVLAFFTFFLSSTPIFLDLNPFYLKEFSRYDDGSIATKRYWKYSYIPFVNADVPNGWKVKTKVFEETKFLATEIPESEKVEGNLSLEIFKGQELIAYLSYVTDTGGLGGTYINFPDSDPEIYQSMLEASLDEDSFISVTTVKEGEYSKLNIFGREVRRVGMFYVPNINQKDNYYFTNPLEPVLFYFGENGPQYNVNNERNDANVKYVIRVVHSLSEEDLLIVDSILESLELR